MNIQSANLQSGIAPEQTPIKSGPSARSEAVAAKEVRKEQSVEAATKPSEEKLKNLVKEANDFIKPLNGSLEFSIDKDTGTTVVKVFDTSTKELIRQFPSEEMLGLSKALGQLKGFLVKQQA